MTEIQGTEIPKIKLPALIPPSGIKFKTGLKHLRPIHLKILALHLTGIKRTEVAAAVGVSPITVTNIIKSQPGKLFLDEAFNREKQDLSALMADAVQVIRDGLHADEPTSIRLATYKEFAKTTGLYEKTEDQMSAEDVAKSIINNIQINNYGK